MADTLREGISLAYGSVRTTLERITDNLERRFPLDAKELPEYQKAIDAIEAFRAAYLRQYNEAIEKSKLR